MSMLVLFDIMMHMYIIARVCRVYKPLIIVNIATCNLQQIYNAI